MRKMIEFSVQLPFKFSDKLDGATDKQISAIFQGRNLRFSDVAKLIAESGQDPVCSVRVAEMCHEAKSV